MTPSSQDIEQYRPGFEAWARKEKFNIERDRNGGYEEYINDLLEVWVAAKLESESGSSTSTSQAAPWAYALVRDGKVEGVERTKRMADCWVKAEIVPLGPITGELGQGDALDATTRAALSDALNTTLWVYRRLPYAYNKPPFVDHAILTMAKVLGMEHVPDAIKERAAITTNTSKEGKYQNDIAN